MRIIDAGGAFEVIIGLDQFPRLPRTVYKRLFEEKQNMVIPNILSFDGITKEDVFEALQNPEYARSFCFDLISNPSQIKGLALDQEFANILAKNVTNVLLCHLEKFKDIDSLALSNKLIASGKISFVVQYVEKFSELDQTFTLAYDMLGGQLTQDAYNTISALKDGSISKEELSALGCTKTGDTGLNQLRQRLSKFKSEILHADFDASALENSDFYQQYYKSYVRYTESEWGKHDGQIFEHIVKTHNQLKSEGRLHALPGEYHESGEVRIAKVDREKQEAFQYSEQFLNRFGALRESIAKALELFDQKKPLSHLIERAGIKRAELLQTLKNKLAQLQHPMAIENLQKRIEILEGLDLRSVKNFQKNFEALSQFSEFHEELRQLVFYYALQKNKDYRESANEMTHQKKPQFDDVRWMINFIEHIVNEETWAKYFTDDRATKSFRKLVNVNALNEEFSRAQNQAVSGTASIEFVPTRGLLMEFSGHIADACWASKYNSMVESFPNFSAVVLIQNRGTKHERLTGASMLIETNAQDGTPLLVIRGLNPIENVINFLNVEDFYKKFTDYIGQIAKNTGRKLAIVIDDHSGGSATNRPALFQLLSEKTTELRKVKLASGEDTTFNGYDIVDCTYIVE